MAQQNTADFPRNADAFKTWADAACAAWPEELTAKAHAAWMAMQGHTFTSPADIEAFATAFADYRAANKA